MCDTVESSDSGGDTRDTEATRICDNLRNNRIRYGFTGEGFLKFGNGINVIIVVVRHPKLGNLRNFAFRLQLLNLFDNMR